jgi:methyl-accepting chemotaxis protein
MHSISTVIHAAASGAEQTKAAAMELNASAAELQQLVSKFRI